MRSKQGVIVSKSGDKSIVVVVHTYRTHPKYKKRFRVSKKFHAHDEKNECKVGDTVTIYETRPLSKLKRWTVEEPKAKPVK
ncbi:MAG: 30S ribosomal protein S17 [Patescibacteria group bacterium]